MQRDLIGYGGKPPKLVWPGNGRLALNFVINLEEGSESNILEGDEQSESYLTDLPGVIPLKGERHLSSESMFEYGSRAGIWRLLELFDKLPITFFATGQALEKNTKIAEFLKSSPYEVAGHGWRWISYRAIPKEVEREHIKKTIQTIEHLTNKKVKGWYTGRASVNTRELIVEQGLEYDSDSYADDLPYWVNVLSKPHLIVPYNLDCNDARFGMTPGFNQGEDFYYYLKATFDQLYLEGSTCPKVMTVGLHPRFSGRPGRANAVARFIEYIKTFDRVWICTREEIAKHFKEGF